MNIPVITEISLEDFCVILSVSCVMLFCTMNIFEKGDCFCIVHTHRREHRKECIANTRPDKSTGTSKWIASSYQDFCLTFWNQTIHLTKSFFTMIKNF